MCANRSQNGVCVRPLGSFMLLGSLLFLNRFLSACMGGATLLRRLFISQRSRATSLGANLHSLGKFEGNTSVVYHEVLQYGGQGSRGALYYQYIEWTGIVASVVMITRWRPNQQSLLKELLILDSESRTWHGIDRVVEDGE